MRHYNWQGHFYLQTNPIYMRNCMASIHIIFFLSFGIFTRNYHLLIIMSLYRLWKNCQQITSTQSTCCLRLSKANTWHRRWWSLMVDFSVVLHPRALLSLCYCALHCWHRFYKYTNFSKCLNYMTFNYKSHLNQPLRSTYARARTCISLNA